MFHHTKCTLFIVPDMSVSPHFFTPQKHNQNYWLHF